MKTHRIFWLILVLMVWGAAYLALPVQAEGRENYWTYEGNGFWNYDANWRYGVPRADDFVYLVTPTDNDIIVTYDYNNYADEWLESLTINGTEYGERILDFWPMSVPLNVRYEYLGTTVRGTFVHNWGTHNLSELYLGSTTTGDGTYWFYGGDLNSDMEHIGYYGSGTFHQYGGDNKTSVYEYIGHFGTGSYHQYGGTNSARNLFLGYETGSSGTYKLFPDATLSTRDLDIGYGGGNGLFEQSGGENIVQRELSFGDNSGDINTCTYKLSSGTLSAQREYLTPYYGEGTFEQSGGINTTGALYVYSGEGSAVYKLSGGDLDADYQHIADYHTGTFDQEGGTNTALHLYVGGYYSPQGDGTYYLSQGDLTAFYETIGIYGNGNFEQTGGDNTVNLTLTIAANPGSSGTYHLSGGSLSAATIINNDTFHYSGGSLTADLTNNGSVILWGEGTRTIDGDVVNNGTFKVTDTTAVYTGTFTNNGAYVSDPSTQTFNDLTVNQTGYLVAGAGDKFLVMNDFINRSTMNVLWDTDDSYLGFIPDPGGDNSHKFYLAGTDLGNGPGGYSDNFAWRTLDVTGSTVYLYDGNTAPGGALYVEEILGVTFNIDLFLTNIYASSTGLTIYYLASANPYLGGKTYSLFGGGSLNPAQPPVPIPPTLILFGFGLMGLAGLRGRLGKIFGKT